MLFAATISFLALALQTPPTGDPSGPYVDTHGRIWHELPKAEDYPTVDQFDKLFAHEVFTDRAGNRFQIDRPLTPAEEAAAAAMQQFNRRLYAPPGPATGYRATVYINVPGDEEYRSYWGSSWSSHANSEIELADNALYSKWAINFIVGAYRNWDSNDSASINGLLDEAFAEWGYGGQEMMIAFSNDPTSGGAVGIAYILSPRQLTKLYGSYEAEITQHEAGHTYGCYHCCVNCIMKSVLTPSAFGIFHNSTESCSGQNHTSVMNANKNRY